MDKFLRIAILFLLIKNSYALPFLIVPKMGTVLPTIVYNNITTYAYYTVTNTAQVPAVNAYVKFLPPNVTQVITNGTFSDTCLSTFNLDVGQSCTLQLNVASAVDINNFTPSEQIWVCFQDGITCAGTNYPLNVMLGNSSLAFLTEPHSFDFLKSLNTSMGEGES